MGKQSISVRYETTIKIVDFTLGSYQSNVKRQDVIGEYNDL